MTTTTTHPGKYHCECGEATGVRCEWTGPVSDLVLVEWMPEHLRASHEAAGNAGQYPRNGAVRFVAEEGCALDLVEADPEWTEILRPARADEAQGAEEPVPLCVDCADEDPDFAWRSARPGECCAAADHADTVSRA